MLAVIILAIGLATDAVAVALVRGAAGEHRIARALEIGAAFGLAQGLIPIAGWALGLAFDDWIAPFDHWIAFGLLGFLGIRMIREAFADEGPETLSPPHPHLHYTALALAALATSLDAGAAGLTLPLFGPPVLLSCAVIAAVTAALCIPAYWLGTKLSARFGKVSEILGGCALIGIGAHILVNHLTA